MRLLDDWRSHRREARYARWDEEHRWDDLARYNSEVHRGLLHTSEWKVKMAEEQKRFDAESYGPPGTMPVWGFLEDE